MQVADFNHTDFSQGRESEADAQLLVRFFLREKEDQTATAEQGRPIFKEREYIEIRAPGKRDAMACRPATHQDKQRFPRHYDAFKRRVEMPVEGTPLGEWPQISRSMVEELSFLKVKTVEQLVAMSDNDASQIRGGLSLKQKAAEFLKYSDKTKLIEEKRSLEERLAAQDARLAELEAKLAGGGGSTKAETKPKAETPPPAIDEESSPPAEEAAEAKDEQADTEEKPRRRRQAKAEG